ncbi:MAG: hypothetical protein Fur0015_05290 [Ignavibacteriales bacterium]
MSKQVNKILNKLFPGRPAYKTLIKNKKSFLYSLGWIESKKRNYPCEVDGSELPWMNYSIIAFLKERLSKNLDIFEFGSGYSTIFYSRLVKSVTSVEHDKNWYELVKEKIPNNVNLIFTEEDTDGKYCRSVLSTKNKYHVIIVDGKDRVNCLKQSIDALEHNGVILLDDSHRDEYREGFLFLKNLGFKKLNFQGLKPNGNGSLDYSTLFYKSENVFHL